MCIRDRYKSLLYIEVTSFHFITPTTKVYPHIHNTLKNHCIFLSKEIQVYADIQPFFFFEFSARNPVPPLNFQKCTKNVTETLVCWIYLLYWRHILSAVSYTHLDVYKRQHTHTHITYFVKLPIC